MIVTAFLEIILDGVQALIALLPTVTFPFSETIDEFAAMIGSQVAALDGMIPITEALPIVQWALLIYAPFLIAFYSFRWLYSMIPVVGR